MASLSPPLGQEEGAPAARLLSYSPPLLDAHPFMFAPTITLRARALTGSGGHVVARLSRETAPLILGLSALPLRRASLMLGLSPALHLLHALHVQYALHVLHAPHAQHAVRPSHGLGINNTSKLP